MALKHFQVEEIEKSNYNNPEYQLWCAVLYRLVADLVSYSDKERKEAYEELFGEESKVRQITIMLDWPRTQHNQFLERCKKLYKIASTDTAPNNPYWRMMQARFS